jgi:hypothetical protein
MRQRCEMTRHRELIRSTRLGKNSFVCTDGRISMLFVGSNYLEASVTSSAQAIRGNCLLRVREVIEFLPSLVGQVRVRLEVRPK